MKNYKSLLVRFLFSIQSSSLFVVNSLSLNQTIKTTEQTNINMIDETSKIEVKQSVHLPRNRKLSPLGKRTMFSPDHMLSQSQEINEKSPRKKLKPGGQDQGEDES